MRLELHYAAVNDAGRETIDEVWRVRSTSARVEVPAGTFTGVTELERETSDGSWISDWAPGVGKVRELGPDGAIELIGWGRPAQPSNPATCAAPPCRR